MYMGCLRRHARAHRSVDFYKSNVSLSDVNLHLMICLLEQLYQSSRTYYAANILHYGFQKGLKCPATEDMKYRMTRVAVDALDVYFIESGTAVHLWVSYT